MKWVVLGLSLGLGIGYSFAYADPSPEAPQVQHGFSLGDAPAAPIANPDGPSPRASLFPPRSPSMPVPSPLLPSTITPAEGKTLLKQFSKAQESELSGLKHRQTVELKELKTAHKAQVSEWDAKEREARHKYFAEHKTGPERRAYVQDQMRRRDLLLKIHNDDEEGRAHEATARLESLKSEQAQRLKEFQDFVNRGERPPVRLWPN